MVCSVRMDASKGDVTWGGVTKVAEVEIRRDEIIIPRFGGGDEGFWVFARKGDEFRIIDQSSILDVSGKGIEFFLRGSED